MGVISEPQNLWRGSEVELLLLFVVISFIIFSIARGRCAHTRGPFNNDTPLRNDIKNIQKEIEKLEVDERKLAEEYKMGMDYDPVDVFDETKARAFAEAEGRVEEGPYGTKLRVLDNLGKLRLDLADLHRLAGNSGFKSPLLFAQSLNFA
ncbi:uncharacterized protein EV420DRAFT_669722 [Desarmillaria tabescens]|uniref:Uncharacterized protein n=1 Tax=Armillaria tabescens TaxID=1929756 RepID=A0AA39NK45_ARMTA|nr:uncharacterized protein EV420DRAFT_669722 [Desarmillaria tabescens]KAK0467154.1 hypothetical protein EV420DRAFT_669722 [Desarmillaria tabescens]